MSHKRRQNWRQKATRPPRASTTRSGGGGNRTRARFLSGDSPSGPQRNTHDMIEMLAAAALAPWAHPLRFAPLAGWRTGASGNVPSLYGPAPVRAPLESSAWIAKNVRYRDRATEDPPNRTLAQLPRRGVIVWAVIFQGELLEHAPIKLDLKRRSTSPVARASGSQAACTPFTASDRDGSTTCTSASTLGPDPRRRHLPRRRGRSISSNSRGSVRSFSRGHSGRGTAVRARVNP